MKTFRVVTLLAVLCISAICASAAVPKGLRHVHPLFWWVGMADPSLQILLHGSDIGGSEVRLSAEGVVLDSVVRPENADYLILYLNLSRATAQRFDIELRQGRRAIRLPYELRERRDRAVRKPSFDASDVLYLLMPDRFANGDKRNDAVKALTDTTQGYDDARHGGDIAGLKARLNYLADLGVTAVWPTPLLENNMPTHSYHGYAITDYYSIDARYGTNEDYRDFVSAAHDKGLRVIQDMVFNHCGNRNFLFTDMPDTTWFNHGRDYVQTSYKISAVSDPHAMRTGRASAQDGWFVASMPDFNQRNPHVLTYLVQNSIWWIEYAGIDGIRQDTYPYADAEAMARWCCRIEREFPGFNIVGETWLGNNVGVSYWQKGSRLAAPFNSGLPTVMDFPLMDILNTALDEQTDDWNRGLARVYDYLSQDAVYADPMHLLIFLDNHDTPRFARDARQAASISRYRQALTLLLTLRGIPQLYYGDEIGMYADKSRGDGALRQNFPGGFSGDVHDAFTAAGRNAMENAYFDFTRKLLHWRRGNKALSEGILRHFPVNNGVYVYTRQAGDRTVTVLMNGTDSPACVDLDRYREALPASQAMDVISGRIVNLSGSLQMGVRGIVVLDFN